MSEHELNRRDLTRWNRAGLSRFDYIDANAVEYLEILRQQLVKRFVKPDVKQSWLSPAELIPLNEVVQGNETQAQRQQRLRVRQQRILEMYHQQRRDWGWEISRTFARACHMLTEHSNAYSNEGFLGTATQWDNVRRLVEMLDYHPAPPSSAYTQLVIQAKESRSGLLEKGFQIQYTPEDGSEKIIYETLDDVLIDSKLNTLRVKDWNKSEQPAAGNANSTSFNEPETRQYPAIAEYDITVIEGIGNQYKNKISEWLQASIVKVKDFENIDPDKFRLRPKIKEKIWGWKAKADILLNFKPQGDWSVLYKMQPSLKVASLARKKSVNIAKMSGNTLELVSALKMEIEIAELCLTQQAFKKLKLADLLVVNKTATESIATSWQDTGKPKIEANDVAMVYRQYSDNNGKEFDQAEAVRIAEIDKQTNFIKLITTEKQSWLKWSKSEAHLMVAAKWQRKCWLNGADVIRTIEPHGFTSGAFVSWKEKGVWKFAEVIESDKRNIRLKLTSLLPQDGTPLYEAKPLGGPNLPANIEDTVALTTGENVPGDDVADIKAGDLFEDKGVTELPGLKSKQNVFDTEGGLIPSFLGKLPDVGSFIIPSPMLPMDLVKAAVKMLLRIGAMVIPSTGEIVFEFLDPDDLAKILFDLIDGENVKWEDGDKDIVLEDIKALLADPEGPISLPDSTEEQVFFKKIAETILQKGPFLIIPKDPPVRAVVEQSKPPYIFEGTSKIARGDWVVGEFLNGLQAVKVKALNEFINTDKSKLFSLEFEQTISSAPELIRIHADFKGDLIATDAAINNTLITGDAIELENIPESLRVGQTVMLGCDNKDSQLSKIEKIEGNFVSLNPPARGYTKGCLIISANVVTAGHGKSKPAKIIGSGDATKSNQEFTLQVENLSFVPDSTMPSGVAAAIDVIIDGRVWQQVATLMDSSSSDHHYTIRMTEQAYVKIIFGDGVNGRRLPSGKNNIRIRYRVGSGLVGNVPAGGLIKPVNPHPIVAQVHQPIAAGGGGDMENIKSLRENAPATLLSLERAVSLADFSHLATSQSSIWQARAYRKLLHNGKTELVSVVVLTAGGIESSQVNESLGQFLQKHAMPGVKVLVENCIKRRFDLSITIRVISDAYVFSHVADAVTLAVSDYFSLKNRKLAEPLYLSEVYKVIEAVQGVENSICVINNDESLQVFKPDNESTVIYLDTRAENNPSELIVNVEEYLP